MTNGTLQSQRNRSRFAPSTTGRAHPGTLLAALLCWLDARTEGCEIVLRLEDLDRERTKAGYCEAMIDDLAWFGLEWDRVTYQSDSHAEHVAALTELVRAGRIYACSCSRAEIRRSAERAPDGSHRYPGTCRHQVVTLESWSDEERPLRLELDSGRVEVEDESGLDLSGDPAALFGDPIVRRRDGAFAYLFASTVDDANAGVTRVVRGRDLAPTTTLQVGIQRTLGFETPRYRHHALLLEGDRGKLSKFHGAVDVTSLRTFYAAEVLCGALAHFVGLVRAGTACRPEELVAGFDWGRVTPRDVPLAWSPETGLTPG